MDALSSLTVTDSALRSHFPVLGRVAYLNAGTDGPLPAAAVQAGQAELERQMLEGRTGAHFQLRGELSERLRGLYARTLGCESADVALTTCTSDGLTTVLGGMSFSAREEILTSDEEHPGLLGALQAVRESTGVRIRTAPLERLHEELGPNTRAIACSHVSWVSGKVAPRELGELGVPVLLDGAQGVGAVPVDVTELGCDAYAGPGQKWLCGPDGTGMLFTTAQLRERLLVHRRGYLNLADPAAGLDSPLHSDARCLDTFGLNSESLACACTALELLLAHGLADIHARAFELCGLLVGMLEDRGRHVASRGPSTLVSFASADPEGERDRLAAGAVVVRDIPGHAMLRASVGAWNDEEDLMRLVDGLDR